MTTETVKTTAPAALEAAKDRGLSPRAARRWTAVERTAYGLAGAAAAVGPHTDAWPLHAAALGAGAGVLYRLWGRTRDRQDTAGLLVASSRALPVLGLSGAYAAALAVPGSSLWEYALPVGVAALAGLAAPLTRSRGLRRAVETLPETIAAQEPAHAPQETPGEDGYRSGLARLWAASQATGGTTLTAITPHAPDRPDFDAVILAPVGSAVPSTLDARTVAGVFDVPVECVELAPVPGYGPGRLAVRVAPTAHAAHQDPGDTLAALWAQRVASPTGAAPGTRLVASRIEDDRIVLRVESADDALIRLPRLQLARALRAPDPELVMVETDGVSQGVVTVYREHPLLTVREATPDDLRMDARGRIAIGMRHDGRPAYWPLYDPELGALTDLLVGAMGSGKSVTLLTLLAAERLSGVVSIVADAQDGMSLPEAQGRVAHFGAGIAAMGATLYAACAVADHRERVSASRGWGSFTLGDPWPLVILTLDEINRAIAEDAETPRDFRRWLVAMIARFQLTGRKLGMGIRLAGQQVHLSDLGGSEKIRSNAKNGSLWLGRVNSSMTQRLASDMTSRAVEVTPIPRYFGVGGAEELEAAWSGEEAPTGPVTAGTAWLIQGGHPVLTRTWRAIKENRTYPHLIGLLESAPMPGLTPEEAAAFRLAYAEGLALAEDLLTEDEEAAPAAGGQAAPPRPAAPAPAAATLADRIVTALADGPLRTREIRAAVGVGTEGGPSSGSVDNALTRLQDEGRAVRTGHGVWALPETS